MVDAAMKIRRPAVVDAPPTLDMGPSLAPAGGGYPGEKLSTSHVCRLARLCVADVLGCDPLLLVGKPRGTRKLAVARQFAIHLAHIVAGRSHEQVAKWFSRNRSTASHHFEVVEDLRERAEFDGFMTLVELRFTLLLQMAEQDAKGAWAKALDALEQSVDKANLEGDIHWAAKFMVETFKERAAAAAKPKRRGKR